MSRIYMIQNHKFHRIRGMTNRQWGSIFRVPQRAFGAIRHMWGICQQARVLAPGKRQWRRHTQLKLLQRLGRCNACRIGRVVLLPLAVEFHECHHWY